MSEVLALEHTDNAFWVHVVWAFQPGDLRIVAICSSDEIAQRYESSAPEIYPAHRIYRERAPIDHVFGGSDLRSVAMRAARRSVRNGD